jgi:hypothetical protein
VTTSLVAPATKSLGPGRGSAAGVCP